MAKQSVSYRTQLISGGNTQQFKKKVRTLIKEAKNETESLRWEWYMNFIAFYASVIKFEGDGAEKLNRVKPFMAEQLFFNGTFAVKKYDEKVGIFNIVNSSKKGLDGYIKEAKCRAVFADDEVVIKAGENGAFMQTDIFRFPYLLNLDIYLDPILAAWDLLTPELQNSITKLVAFVPDEKMKDDTYLQEVENVMNTTSLVKFWKGKPIQLQKIDSNSNNDKLWGHIKSLINFMYKMRGRKINISEKESGVSQSEVDTNDEQFDIVIENMLLFWDNFINDYNKSYGTSIKVIKNEIESEDKDENKDDKQPNNKNTNTDMKQR